MTLDLTAGLWLSKCNQWHLDLRAWVAPDHRVWLVPARLDLGARPSFQLRPQRLRPESAPWTDAAGREAGLALADMLFAEER